MNVIAVNPTTLRITIPVNYIEESNRLKHDIPREQRMYDPSRKIWTITDADKLVHLDYVRRALDEYGTQLPLF